MNAPTNITGKVTQVIGAVVDVQFTGELPAILNALETKNGDQRLDGVSLVHLPEELVSELPGREAEGPAVETERLDAPRPGREQRQEGVAVRRGEQLAVDYVELRDLDAARANGIAFGAVSWGFTTREALAARVPEFLFDAPGEIARAILAE